MCDTEKLIKILLVESKSSKFDLSGCEDVKTSTPGLFKNDVKPLKKKVKLH